MKACAIYIQRRLHLVILCKTNNVMILDSLSFYLEKKIGFELTDV